MNYLPFEVKQKCHYFKRSKTKIHVIRWPRNLSIISRDLQKIAPVNVKLVILNPFVLYHYNDFNLVLNSFQKPNGEVNVNVI